MARNDMAAARTTSGMSSMKMPSPEQKAALRDTSWMWACLVMDQNPLVFSSGGSSSDSAGGCHDTGSWSRSHWKAAMRSARSRSQKANVSMSVWTAVIAGSSWWLSGVEGVDFGGVAGRDLPALEFV